MDDTYDNIKQWPNGTPKHGPVGQDGEHEWTEEIDKNGRRWFKRRPRFFGRRLTIRVPTLAEGAARLRQLDDLREKRELGLISERQALAAVGALERGGLITVDEVWSSYVAGCSDRTRKIANSVWIHHLRPYFGGKAAAALDANVMSEWEQKEKARPGRREGELQSRKTTRNAYDLLHAAFARAVAAGKLEEVPWTGAYKAPRVPNVMQAISSRQACSSIVELQLLVRAAMDHDAKNLRMGRFSDVAARVFVVAMLGLRQGEACALSWEDLRIDREPHDCTLRFQVVDGWRVKHPEWTRPRDALKSDRETFAIHPAAVRMLHVQRDALRARGVYQDDGPVFPAIGGRSCVGGWRSHAELIDPDLFRSLVEAAGLPASERWVPHSLRHTFATLEAQSIPSIRDLQARTGHASVQVMMGYLHRAGRGQVQSGIDLRVVEGLDLPELPEPDELGKVLAEVRERFDGLPAATVERGRLVEAARDEERKKKRAENRRAYAKRNGLIGPEKSYTEVLARATNEEIRDLLAGGRLGHTLNHARRRAYIGAYTRNKALGKEAARAAAGRAELMWRKNFYDALRKNARVRGLLPEGWTAPTAAGHGTPPAKGNGEG
jgi:integrase